MWRGSGQKHIFIVLVTYLFFLKWIQRESESKDLAYFSVRTLQMTP